MKLNYIQEVWLSEIMAASWHDINSHVKNIQKISQLISKDKAKGFGLDKKSSDSIH